MEEALLDSPAGATQEDVQSRIGELFDRHQGRLQKLAARMSRDREEARDLVQETFMRAARHAASIPAEAQGAEAWLVRTLVNLCRDRQRRLRVRMPEKTRRNAPPSAEDPGPALLAALQVRQALGALQARRRAVVVLHELEGRPAGEVARLLGMSPVTVRWHLSRARRELRVLLEPVAGQGGGE